MACKGCGKKEAKPALAGNSPGFPRSRFADAAERVARSLEANMAGAFMQAVETLQRQVREGALRAALAGGNLKKIQELTGAFSLKSLLENDPSLPLSFQRATTVSGQAASDILAGVTGLDVQFNFRDPRVVLFAREQTAGLVVQIGESTREAIRLVVAAGADLGLTTASQARAIREIVGLPPNWAQAPMNLAQEIRLGQAGAATSRRLSATDKAQIRSRITAGTVDEAFVETMQSRYASSLIHRRALNIARTETIRAAHMGQQISWTQAIEAAHLPPTVKRFWIITPDTRLSDEHARIPGMNPEGRGMNEPFQTDGPAGSFLLPPIRPNCRCGVGLDIPGIGLV